MKRNFPLLAFLFTVPLREQLAAMIIYHDGSCFC